MGAAAERDAARGTDGAAEMTTTTKTALHTWSLRICANCGHFYWEHSADGKRCWHSVPHDRDCRCQGFKAKEGVE